jgi:diaminohydroxyphosphoribosylaminopyrimidine deaminase/5-amino-6-(5-phosphoribosylamino)uracil reductase
MKQYTHAHFILRCIELARNGGKNVSPNPLVGSVLVENNEILGEGFHEEYGKAHAEVNAFSQVKSEHLQRINKATLYVSLEPCNIFGKTPPCTNLIIEKKIKKVVISALDVSPEVNGNGVSLLAEHGIEIIQDVLNEQGRELVKQRSIFVTRKRPYTILKLAVSKDGFYASDLNINTWLSSPITSRLTHKWRAENDAILVGTNTALIDNPILDTRYFPGKNPIKFVLDRDHILPNSLSLFKEPEVAKIFTSEKLTENDIEIRVNNRGELNLQEISAHLYSQNIGSLLVEGGGKLIQSYLETDLWDELRIIRTKKYLLKGKKIKINDLEKSKSFFLGKDLIEVYLNLKLHQIN